MSPYRPPKTAAFRLSILTVCLLLAAVIACEPPGGGTPETSGTLTVDSAVSGDSAPPNTRPRPTPAPPFADINSATAQEVLQYAATLEFVDELARVDTAYIVEGSRRALMRISPEIGARTLTTADLQRGRITARWMRAPDSVRYPMATMVGYIWTDSVPSSGWRFLYFPSDPTLARGMTGGFAMMDNNPNGDSNARSDMVRSGPVAPYSCYYSNRRWICPMTGGLTQEEVTRAYNTR